MTASLARLVTSASFASMLLPELATVQGIIDAVQVSVASLFASVLASQPMTEEKMLDLPIAIVGGVCLGFANLLELTPRSIVADQIHIVSTLAPIAQGALSLMVTNFVAKDLTDIAPINTLLYFARPIIFSEGLQLLKLTQAPPAYRRHQWKFRAASIAAPVLYSAFKRNQTYFEYTKA